eukprot:4413527-Alexandrium_andersonii.AAC.1
MGWLVLSRARYDSILKDPASGGIVSWHTADSSPQGAYDWLSRASACAKSSDCLALLADAHALCANPEPVTERTLVQRLRASLLLAPGAPAGLGPG